MVEGGKKVPAQREKSLSKALDHPENWDWTIVQRMESGLFHFDYVEVDGARLKSIQIESIWIILFHDYIKEIQWITFFSARIPCIFSKHFISKQKKEMKQMIWRTSTVPDSSNNWPSFMLIA